MGCPSKLSPFLQRFALNGMEPQQVIMLIMRTPKMKKKVAKEMGQARTDIDARLVPQGPNVTRHLALPQQSKSLEWILDEMATMDNESKSHTNYREGKLSGAVYRTCRMLLQGIRLQTVFGFVLLKRWW